MKTRRTSPTSLVVLACFIIAASWVQLGHANAPPGRYTTSNGTVYDTMTLLTWQQAAPPQMSNWGEAQAYCAALDLDGTGWRLPSMKELQTIVDTSRIDPAIDPNAFPSTPLGSYWASPYADLPDFAWYVVANDGTTDDDFVTRMLHVRCVR